MFRWTQDDKCVGPFPSNFEKYERTLRDLRKTRFGKSPNTPHEIEKEFKKPDVLNSLGRSLYHESGLIYNGIQIEHNFSNCIFSSPHCISLVKKNLNTNERFFLMDATFRITPRGVYEQVLILHIKFGLKVSRNRIRFIIFEKNLFITNVPFRHIHLSGF